METRRARTPTVERFKNFSIQHFRKWIQVDRDAIGYPFVFGDVLIQIALTLDRARHIETAKAAADSVQATGAAPQPRLSQESTSGSASAHKNAPESNHFL